MFLFPLLSVIFLAPGILDASASTNDIDATAFCWAVSILSSCEKENVVIKISAKDVDIFHIHWTSKVLKSL